MTSDKKQKRTQEAHLSRYFGTCSNSVWKYKVERESGLDFMCHVQCGPVNTKSLQTGHWAKCVRSPLVK